MREFRDAIRIVPDVVMRAGGSVQSVLDCKFKRTNAGTFKHHDFYHVVAYCTALGTRLGGLVYPRTELPLEDSDETFILSSDIVVRRFAVDLAVPPQLLEAEVRRAAEEVFSWLGAHDGLPGSSDVYPFSFSMSS